MARTAKNIVDYFPHSVSHKQTMFIIESRYSNDGYAFWFKLLEMIGKTPGHYINCQSLPTWQYLLSYTHLEHNTALEVLNLLAELDAIDKDLWKHQIIWSQNFITGIEGVYKKRGATIPEKPSPNGKVDIKPFLAQPVTEMQPHELEPVTEMQPHELEPVTEMQPHELEPVTENDKGKQSKGKQSKGKYNNPSGDESQENIEEFINGNETSLKDYKDKLQIVKNKIGYLVYAFKRLHTDRDNSDDENCYGKMGGLINKIRKDYGFALKIIWDSSSKSITGQHFAYMMAIANGEIKKADQKKVQDKIEQPRSIRLPDSVERVT